MPLGHFVEQAACLRDAATFEVRVHELVAKREVAETVLDQMGLQNLEVREVV